MYIAGHSLHTTAKPTFNNRKPNPLWWTKAQEGNGEVDDAARRRAEIAAIKREEEQLHQEALYVVAAAGVDPAIFSREASEGLLAD